MRNEQEPIDISRIPPRNQDMILLIACCALAEYLSFRLNFEQQETEEVPVLNEDPIQMLRYYFYLRRQEEEGIREVCQLFPNLTKEGVDDACRFISQCIQELSLDDQLEGYCSLLDKDPRNYILDKIDNVLGRLQQRQRRATWFDNLDGQQKIQVYQEVLRNKLQPEIERFSAG